MSGLVWSVSATASNSARVALLAADHLVEELGQRRGRVARRDQLPAAGGASLCGRPRSPRSAVPSRGSCGTGCRGRRRPSGDSPTPTSSPRSGTAPRPRRADAAGCARRLPVTASPVGQPTAHISLCGDRRRRGFRDSQASQATARSVDGEDHRADGKHDRGGEERHVVTGDARVKGGVTDRAAGSWSGSPRASRGSPDRAAATCCGVEESGGEAGVIALDTTGAER